MAKSKENREGEEEFNPENLKPEEVPDELAEGTVGVIIHEELFPAIQMLEKVFQSHKWNKIVLRVGHKDDKSVAVVETYFIGEKGIIIAAPKGLNFGKGKPSKTLKFPGQSNN